MKIEWLIEETLPDGILCSMQKAADLCLTCEGITVPCSVTVRLCSDEVIAEINERCRGITRSTDVLSFPTVHYPAGKTAISCEKNLRQEYDDESDSCFLGDIFISVPHLLSQAQEYGHSVEREAAYLLVHGICHLMGYDHIEEADREKMRQLEEKILAKAEIK